MSKLSRRSFAIGAAALGVSTTTLRAAPRPPYVNLARFQTPLKNQGSRTTCITFGAIAALEAAYLRAGYGALDLSEQFLNHVGKMTWLHYPWDDVLRRGEDAGESQVGAFGGGGGAGYVEALASGLKVPLEQEMPYRNHDFTASDHPHLARAWDDARFWTQRHMNDFNLDPRFLPRRATHAATYYSVRRFAKVAPNNADAIEAVLASGREVVWDFGVANTGQDARIWQDCAPGQPNCPNGGHCMLLIGYDRRYGDRAQHHFIAKNTWGRTAHPDGYTRISYDYIRRGYAAAYIIEVEPPGPWSAPHFFGRWNLSFDGHHGTLDIYHLPGASNWIFRANGIGVPDRRIGSFYDSEGKAYKVNGEIVGNRIGFFIDSANRYPRWDRLSGRNFVYYLTDDLMSGVHTDPGGSVWGGYARRGQPYFRAAQTPRPLSSRSYIGTWQALLDVELGNGTLRFDRESGGGTLTGSFTSARARNQTFPVSARVDPATGRQISLKIGVTDGRNIHSLVGYHLSHEAGTVAGHASSITPSGVTQRHYGFVLLRA
jgi:Papain family cysteine protease